jgi:hypothetical protein
LEAKLSDGRPVWGAVGFRNSVSDSAADRRWVKQKFAADLRRALDEFPHLKAFVFLTNVELTVGERESLVASARELGLEFSDVFHRERLRILLDSPDGLAARYQYLNIPLSDAEQAAFFARWGGQLEELITKQFAAVERQLGRLEFLQACSRPLRSIGFSLRLHRPFTAVELGRFGAVVSIVHLHGHAPYSKIEIGVRSRESDRLVVATSGGLWVTPWPSSDDENEWDVPAIEFSGFSAAIPQPTDWIVADAQINGWKREITPTGTLGELDSSFVALFVTAPLAPLIRSFRLRVNEFTLLDVAGADLEPYVDSDMDVSNLWPSRLPSDEVALPWVRLDPGGRSTSLDFSSQTPTSIYSPQRR